MKFSEISLFGNQYELALHSSLQLRVQNSELFEIPFYFHCNSIDIFFTGEEVKRHQSKELSKKKLNYKFKELFDRNYIINTI